MGISGAIFKSPYGANGNALKQSFAHFRVKHFIGRFANCP